MIPSCDGKLWIQIVRWGSRKRGSVKIKPTFVERLARCLWGSGGHIGFLKGGFRWERGSHLSPALWIVSISISDCWVLFIYFFFFFFFFFGNLVVSGWMAGWIATISGVGCGGLRIVGLGMKRRCGSFKVGGHSPTVGCCYLSGRRGICTFFWHTCRILVELISSLEVLVFLPLRLPEE